MTVLRPKAFTASTTTLLLSVRLLLVPMLTKPKVLMELLEENKLLTIMALITLPITPEIMLPRLTLPRLPWPPITVLPAVTLP